MKLEFLGTRGNIDTQTAKHKHHSTIKVSYYHHEVIIDCGEDWAGKVSDWNADAIIITHAHPDHAFGLKDGAPCPVYATEKAWKNMDSFKIEEPKIINERERFQIPKNGTHPLFLEAFPVLHSTRAPAVGYKVQAGEAKIFYVPDVAWIKDREAAMKGIDIYIGDGATLKRSMIRKPGDTIIGHVPLQTQLTWCQKMGVSKAVFTHLGSKILESDEEKIIDQIMSMAHQRDIDDVTIAHDGMEIIIR